MKNYSAMLQQEKAVHEVAAEQLLKKEFVEILSKLYPSRYPTDFADWTNQWGKGVIDRGEYDTVKRLIPVYKEQLQAQRVEAARIEAERLEVERVEAARIEAERVEAEELEWEDLERDDYHDFVMVELQGAYNTTGF
ncbi:MAG: hypothetical protein AB8B66_01990 [Rickettsiaceae bacterium]